MSQPTAALKKKEVKKWYTIVSPPMFGEKPIGSSLSASPDIVRGRNIEISLNELTGNVKHFYTNIILIVNSIKGTTATTEYIGQTIREDRILRLVNRWSSRIDSIDDLKTKDNISIRVKSIAVTRKRVNTSIKEKIRALMSEKVNDFCTKRDLIQIINNIIAGDLHRIVLKDASKIYPLKGFEIRKIEVQRALPKEIKHEQKSEAASAAQQSA